MHRVLVLGRKRLYAEALARMIASAEGWSASTHVDGSGPAAPGPEAVDVVLLETSMEERPHDWLERLRAGLEEVPLVVIGPDHGVESRQLRRAVRARGSVSSTADLDALLQVLEQVCAGHAVGRVLDGSTSSAATGHRSSPDLTPRQIEIVRRLSAADPPEWIAASLGISPNTLRTHMRNIMVRLDVSSRVEAVARARQLGLLRANAGAPH